jgi:hypothetical protein
MRNVRPSLTKVAGPSFTPIRFEPSIDCCHEGFGSWMRTRFESMVVGEDMCAM